LFTFSAYTQVGFGITKYIEKQFTDPLPVMFTETNYWQAVGESGSLNCKTVTVVVTGPE